MTSELTSKNRSRRNRLSCVVELRGGDLGLRPVDILGPVGEVLELQQEDRSEVEGGR